MSRATDALEKENAKLREQGARLFDKTLELGTENAKLRTQLTDVTESVGRMEERCAKLRELVLDMYRCSDPCNDCPHYDGSTDGFYCDLGVGWKARRLRELGIE